MYMNTGFDKYINYLNSHNINFEFLYKEYNIMRVPFERPNILFTNSLEYYIIKVFELNKNIDDAIKEGDNPTYALRARKHFDTVMGQNWRNKLQYTIDFITNYESRFRQVKDKVLLEKMINEQPKI